MGSPSVFQTITQSHCHFTLQYLPPPNKQTTTNPTKQTAFLEEHPGGAKILKRMAGKDATKSFWKYHNDKVLPKYGAKLKVGTLAESAKL